MFRGCKLSKQDNPDEEGNRQKEFMKSNLLLSIYMDTLSFSLSFVYYGFACYVGMFIKNVD